MATAPPEGLQILRLHLWFPKAQCLPLVVVSLGNSISSSNNETLVCSKKTESLYAAWGVYGQLYTEDSRRCEITSVH
jgi:hypothetical protein